jgi:hypothetical protein
VLEILRNDDRRHFSLDDTSVIFSDIILVVNEERARAYADYMASEIINGGPSLFVMLMLSLQPGLVRGLELKFQLSSITGDVTQMIANYRQQKYTAQALAYDIPKIQCLVGAATHYHPQILVRALPSTTQSEWYSTITIAAEKGYHDLILEIIGAGYTEYNTIAYYAAVGGHKVIVDDMIARGATNYQNILEAASRSGSMDIIKDMIARDVTSYLNAYHNAIENGHREVIDFFLKMNPQFKLNYLTRDRIDDAAESRGLAFIRPFVSEDGLIFVLWGLVNAMREAEIRQFLEDHPHIPVLENILEKILLTLMDKVIRRGVFDLFDLVFDNYNKFITSSIIKKLLIRSIVKNNRRFFDRLRQDQRLDYDGLESSFTDSIRYRQAHPYMFKTLIRDPRLSQLVIRDRAPKAVSFNNWTVFKYIYDHYSLSHRDLQNCFKASVATNERVFFDFLLPLVASSDVTFLITCLDVKRWVLPLDCLIQLTMKIKRYNLDDDSFFAIAAIIHNLFNFGCDHFRNVSDETLIEQLKTIMGGKPKPIGRLFNLCLSASSGEYRRYIRCLMSTEWFPYQFIINSIRHSSSTQIFRLGHADRILYLFNELEHLRPMPEVMQRMQVSGDREQGLQFTFFD